MTGGSEKEGGDVAATAGAISSDRVRNVPTGPARRGPIGAEPARLVAGQPGEDKGPVIWDEALTARIDARAVYYKTLNEQIRELIDAGATRVVLDNVNGQRYIGAALRAEGVTLVVNGVPGNDLGTFMSGPTLIVNDNAQDGVANTMNAGTIVVNGDAGDVLGYGMRGGSLYVRGDVGYRVGIHMKAYQDQRPVIVAGGRARDFLGEYMAGGELLLLGLDLPADGLVGSYVGTGMHGGVIYLRGEVAEHQLGREVSVAEPTAEEEVRIREILVDYCRWMGHDLDAVLARPFVKLFPFTHRPYGRMYAY
jgi:glutamate synthase domain-containing protein 3